MNLHSYIDATILRPDARIEEIEQLCDVSIEHQFAAVCVAPTHVPYVSQRLSNTSVQVCTVIGFPNGNTNTDVKIYETELMIALGATEIDFVLNRNLLADGDYTRIEEESKQIIERCRAKHIVSKWIIESSAIGSEELKQLCAIANRLNPTFVKTCTGFFGSARIDDVKKMRELLLPSIQIKASGGIKTREQALEFIACGANRIGTSSTLEMK